MQDEQRVAKPGFNDLLIGWRYTLVSFKLNNNNNNSNNSILSLGELTPYFGMGEYWVFSVLFFRLDSEKNTKSYI